MNIKSTFATIIMAFITAIPVFSQDNAIKFNVLYPKNTDLPEQVSNVIRSKLITALDRSQASTESNFNVFAVQPEISFRETVETEGLIREIGRVAADLTLNAINIIDGEIYYSISIPLSGSATGGKDAALKAMGNSFRPSDPVFVRFVRTARKRINDYYTENCSNIIEQGRHLATLGKFKEAASYLGAIPPAVPCYDEAAVIVREISPYLETSPDTVIVEHFVEIPVEQVVEIQAEPDTVIIEKVIEKIVPVEVRVPASSPQVPTTLSPKITIDGTGLDLKVNSCTGDLSRRHIIISTTVINHSSRDQNPYVYFDNAFTDEGSELRTLRIQSTNSRGGSITMPSGIPVKCSFIIKDIDARFNEISYVQISIRGIRVSIRNLPVQWEQQ